MLGRVTGTGTGISGWSGPANRDMNAGTSLVQFPNPVALREVVFMKASTPKSIQLGRPGLGGVKVSVLQHPPTTSAFSNRRTSYPRSLRNTAGASSPMPPPTMQTSLIVASAAEGPDVRRRTTTDRSEASTMPAAARPDRCRSVVVMFFPLWLLLLLLLLLPEKDLQVVRIQNLILSTLGSRIAFCC